MSKTSIKCVVTGKTKAVRPDVYEQRVKKYGSEDDMLQNYISRDAKRLLRDGKSVDDIRKELGVDATAAGLPDATSIADAVSKIIEKPNPKKSSSTSTKSESEDISLDNVGDHSDADDAVKKLLGVISK